MPAVAGGCSIVLARDNGYRHHFASNRPEIPG